MRDVAIALRDDGSCTLYAAEGARRAVVVNRGSREEVVTLSVVDFTAEPAKVLWSRAFPRLGVDLALSVDGSRVGIAGDGGWLIDATTGELLIEQHDLGLKVVVERSSAATPTPR